MTRPNSVETWRRHPADAARLVLALAVFLVSVSLTLYTPDLVRDLSADLVQIVRRLPLTLRRGFVGFAQLAALIVPVATLVALGVNRRVRLIATIGVGALIASALQALLQDWFDRVAPPDIFHEESWLTGSRFPSGSYLAGLAAGAVILGPRLTRDWRRVLLVGVAVAALIRVLTAAVVPVNVISQLALGAAVGSAVLVIGGAPTRRLSRRAIAAGLERAGISVGSLREVGEGEHQSRIFEAIARLTAGPTADSHGHDEGEGEGTDAIVKVVGADERDADLLMRALRTLRVKGVEDDRPGWSPNRAVEHEALTLLSARDAGIATAPFLGVSTTESGEGIVALGRVTGRRLDTLAADEIDDAVLRDTWDALDRLHRRRIAHRWASAHHVLVDSRGAADTQVTLLDFRWSSLAAPETALSLDVANLAVSLTQLVGAERTIASARVVVPTERLAAALPYVQRSLLTTDVSARFDDRSARDADLAAVREELQAATGVEEIELADVRRVTVGGVVSLLGGAFLAYVALAFASNWSAIVSSLQGTDWSRFPFLLVLAFSGYLTGAMSLMGAVPGRLPLGATTQVMLAQTYLNRFTPANAGGMALRARYLQRQGSDLTVAAASVGITSAASGVIQLLFLASFAVAAGRSDSITGFSLPDVSTMAVIVLFVLVLAGALYLLPWGRRVVFGRITTSLRKVVGEVVTLAKDPVKLALLFGGATLAKLATVIAFVVSCRMLGITEGFAQLGLLFMTANTVASAAPTPGGLGALEAALFLALSGAGVDPEAALAAVLVFRLATYWAPVLPSWVMLRHVQRAGVV